MASFGPFSSESSTRVDTRNTAFNTGFSEIGGAATSVNLDLGGKVKLGKGAILQPTFQLTDQGAINAAQELASASIKSVELLGSNLSSTLEAFAASIRAQGNDLIGAVTSANRASIEAVSSANRTEVENLGLAAIKWGALALGGWFVLRAIMGAK